MRVAALCLCCWLGLCHLAGAATLVRVGGYEFAPFVELDAQGRARGLTPALIDAFNQQQNQYRFEFVATSPARRYRDFTAGKFDLLFFESVDWGWTEQKLPVSASQVFLEGGERYIARRAPDRDQHYFGHFEQRRMVGIRGYHYGFAQFNADPDYLARAYRMTLVHSNAASIDLILKGRGDIAVVTDAYLNRYLREHPAAQAQLLISDTFDQPYRHTILLRRGGKPDVAEINQLLQQLAKTGTLQHLWQRYGVQAHGR